MAINDLLDLLEPFPRQIVRMIYVEGLSLDTTAQALAVELVVVATTLAVAFRRIVRHVVDDHEHLPDLASLSASTVAVTTAS